MYRCVVDKIYMTNMDMYFIFIIISLFTVIVMLLNIVLSVCKGEACI
jgi:hypothetical protein